LLNIVSAFGLVDVVVLVAVVVGGTVTIGATSIRGAAPEAPDIPNGIFCDDPPITGCNTCAKSVVVGSGEPLVLANMGGADVSGLANVDVNRSVVVGGADVVVVKVVVVVLTFSSTVAPLPWA
jgi:hypothetical protein